MATGGQGAHPSTADLSPRLVARLLAGCAGVVAAVTLIGWLAGVSALTRFGPGLAPMKFNTACAVALALLSLAVMVEVSDSALWWILRGRDTGASIMRRVMPAVLLVVPVVGYLRLRGEQRGWFDARFSLTLMVTVVIVVLTVVVG